MKKIKNLILLILTPIILTQCSNKDNFSISKEKVGKLTLNTTIQEVKQIFAKDSIVEILSEGVKGNSYFQEDDEYKIYEKGGNLLLSIVPKEQLDSTSTIKSIQIFDERFTTKNGLNLGSTFEDVNANVQIDNIETSFSSATLFIDELNATIVIDKEELGLKEFSTKKISLEQIPDLAKIKSFIIWFN